MVSPYALTNSRLTAHLAAINAARPAPIGVPTAVPAASRGGLSAPPSHVVLAPPRHHEREQHTHLARSVDGFAAPVLAAHAPAPKGVLARPLNVAFPQTVVVHRGPTLPALQFGLGLHTEALPPPRPYALASPVPVIHAAGVDGGGRAPIGRASAHESIACSVFFRALGAVLLVAAAFFTMAAIAYASPGLLAVALFSAVSGSLCLLRA